MRLLLFLTALAFAAPSYGVPRNDRHDNAGSDIMNTSGNLVKCNLCKIFVGDLQKALETHVDEIIAAADKLCAKKPIIFGVNCTTVTDEVIGLLVQVVDELTAMEICEELELCDAQEELLPPRSERTFLRMLKYLTRRAAFKNQMQKKRMMRYFRMAVGEDYQCDLCEDVVGFLHDAVACNETWTEIANLLIPTCQYCPVPEECVKFYKMLPASAKQFADKFLDSTNDCQLVGLCPEEDTWADLWAEEELEEDEDEEEELEEEERDEEEELLELMEETEALQERVLSQLEAMKKRAYWRRSRFGMRKDWYLAKKAALKGSRFRRYIPSVEVVLSDTFGEEEAVEYGFGNLRQLPEGLNCELCEEAALIGERWLIHHGAELEDIVATYFSDFCGKLPQAWRSECNEAITEELPVMVSEVLRNLLQPRALCAEMFEVCPVNDL